MTTLYRRNDLIRFMHALYEQNPVSDVFSLFDTELLSSGIEGYVARGNFQNTNTFTDPVAIKIVDLASIKHSKNISSLILKMTPSTLYSTFLSSKAATRPSLIELISVTLTNQLVLQKVCPNFALNYYWEYVDQKLISFGEFFTAKTFSDWLRLQHTPEKIYNAFFQIFVALVALKRYFNMIHADLHPDNILVNEIQAGGYWTYKVNGVKYYVPNLGFQIHVIDFGFSWIPDHMRINWYYKDTLQYLTPIGKEFYDVLKLIHGIEYNRLPNDVQSYLQMFLHDILHPTTMFTKKNLYTMFPLKFVYQNVGLVNPKIQLEDILYQMYFTNHERSYAHRYKRYGQRIESFSLDKTFDSTKLPRNLRHFTTN